MKTIFVVSPDYLEAILSEVENTYSFALQGYGNFKTAYKNFKYVNPVDLLGVAIIMKEMPNSRDEIDAMNKFLNLCNLQECQKKVIIVIKEDIPSSFKLAQYNMLDITIKAKTELITDSFIKQDVIGEILLANYKPYEIVAESPKYNLSKFKNITLQYKPVVSENIIKIFSDVVCYQDFNNTIEYDSVLQSFKQNELFYLLRWVFICKKFNKNFQTEIKSINEKIKGLSKELQGLFHAILYLLEGDNFEFK